MQIWSADCTLKTWQVRTICPVGWSEEEGDGMDVCADAGKAVGMDVEKLKSGGATGSAGAGDENEEGVEACSVAKRSGVGVEAAGMMHPMMNMRNTTARVILILFMIHLD